MKCSNCKKLLSKFYFRIGMYNLCKPCSLEIMQDVREFKIEIKSKGGKQ